MLKIVVKSYIKADKLDEYLALTKTLVEETNKNDVGCIRYELFQAIDNPQIMTMIEEWESQEALDKHSSSKHFLEIIPQLGQFNEQMGDATIYKKVF
jgi:quinol monooxygenase YgiN